MARKPKKLPDYFTPDEALALVAAAPGYQVRMAMRIMLRTGLRVSECLSLRPTDLRLTQDPPILSLRPDVPGNKAKRGREVSVPAGTWWSHWRTWSPSTAGTVTGRSSTSAGSGSARA